MARRILFVDDEANVLDSLRRMLHDQIKSWDMDFAISANEATALMAENQYDAVVLDVNLPGKDGLKLLSEMKTNKKTRDIEVIMLTGLQDESLKRQALNIGAADLLSKPASKEDLIARLNSVLRIKTYRDELKAQKAALEHHLAQSQKMELAGMLSARAADELNNILMAMQGYNDIIRNHLPEEAEVQNELQRAEKVGKLATKTIDQILNFTRYCQVPSETCYMNELIDESAELLKAFIPEGVKIEFKGMEVPYVVKADSAPVYQILMNLVLNACKAMENGGILGISLGRVVFNEDSALGSSEIRPGPYVKLQVSDTGKGMDQTALEHVFDPLFSAGKAGNEKDLGLFVVESIVKGLGGMITVDSFFGKGTTFTVCLPSS